MEACDGLVASVRTTSVSADFVQGPYRRFPVMQSNRLVGQISRHDVLRALEDLW